MSDDEDFGDRVDEKMMEMDPGSFSALPYLLKVVGLALSYLVFSWTGFFSVLYLWIGESLARRVGQERWKPKWLAVMLLWPLLIALDVANIGGGGAE